jgi:ribosomal protein S18 acetylase RimI-like enzyme
MPFATRHRDDPMPALAPLEGLEVHLAWDAGFMAALQGRSETVIAERFAAGHRAYVAWVDEVPAAWGWVATRTATIGEMDATFAIPAGERYLWNFVTLPSHRGRGVYPRLLQAIVRAESAEATRFWIAHAPENHASAAGIRKAGFATMAEMSFDLGGRPALRAVGGASADAAAALLGMRATAEPLTPCWRCVRAGRGPMACAEGSCRCDYQVQESGCAAKVRQQALPSV